MINLARQGIRRGLVLLMVVVGLGFAGVASAVFVEEQLDDPALEMRARDIAEGIRCLVCQNQSIMESNADLARDLRLLVRERVATGDTDDEVRAYLVQRFGDWILLNPPFKARTLILWLSPFLLLLFGSLFVVRFLRRKSEGAATLPLTDVEEAELHKIMATDKNKSEAL